MENVNISKKKLHYKVNAEFANYLKLNNRVVNLPISYEDLVAYNDAIPVYDKEENDTLWLNVFYDQSRMTEINEALKRVYSIIKSDGSGTLTEHLSVSRIEYCTFGNSKPFRIRIINNYNDNYDYYYIKKADASRIYGLELEHILSPNRIQFLVDGNTLIEEHIAGIPGDMFLKYYMEMPGINKTRLAKEFIKFNERCFVKLLGDMRSYNFVIDITQDFDDTQYRVRAIDFDQQCYEGNLKTYLCQFFKENRPFVEMCTSLINYTTTVQYQKEERSLMYKRMRADKQRIDALLNIMKQDSISTSNKKQQLSKELAHYYKDEQYQSFNKMGEMLEYSLENILDLSYKKR